MYRIAGNFRWVLIFAISRTVYGVVKIKTAIIYSNRYSNGRFIWNRENKNRKKLFHTLLPLNRKNFRSRKFPAIRYLKEKQYKIAMILLCPVQGPWASSSLYSKSATLGGGEKQCCGNLMVWCIAFNIWFNCWLLHCSTDGHMQCWVMAIYIFLFSGTTNNKDIECTHGLPSVDRPEHR